MIVSPDDNQSEIMCRDFTYNCELLSNDCKYKALLNNFHLSQFSA